MMCLNLLLSILIDVYKMQKVKRDSEQLQRHIIGEHMQLYPVMI